MSKYIYSNKVAEKRSPQTIEIKQLSGLNTSMPQDSVEDFQAVHLQNFLPIHNQLRKRKGFEQVGKYKINGIWNCYFNGEYITIVHIGNNFFYVNDVNNYVSNGGNYHLINKPQNLTIEDKKSWGIYANDRLYVLCGTYIVIKFSVVNNVFTTTMKAVAEDTDTYIPTTTIGITAQGSDMAIERVSMSAPNMLNSKRVNTLNSRVNDSLNPSYNDYGTQVKRVYALDDKFSEIVSMTITLMDKASQIKKVNCTFSAGEGYIGIFVQKSQLGSFDGTLSDNPSIGRIYIGDDVGIVELDYDFKNPYIDDNIEIVFASLANVAIQNASIINKCTFGILFGVDGNRNRLFLSGNPDYRNMDFHSSFRAKELDDYNSYLDESKDFTYFPVDGLCSYGTQNSAILSYELMGNNELLVVKEYIENEPSLYIRGAETETRGDNELVELYPLKQSNINYGGIKGLYNASGNLDNDIVFLTEYGLYGISASISATNLSSNYQFAFSRCKCIEKELIEKIKNAANIATIRYQNYFFITIKDNEDEYITYVANGRERISNEETKDNAYDYAWYVLDGIKADDYLLFDNKLYFVNADGLYLWDFDKKIYSDIKKIVVHNGDIEQFYEDNEYKIVYSIEDLVLSDKDYITLENDDLYIKFDVTIISNTKSYINQPIVNNTLLWQYIQDSSNEFYLYNHHDNDFEKVIVSIDENDNAIIKNSSGYDIDSQNDFDLDKIFVKASGNYKVSIDEENEDNLLFYDKYNNIVYFVNDNVGQSDIPIPITGVITHYDVVECYYYTKQFNCGNSLYSKFLRTISTNNSSNELSVVNFGIITKTAFKAIDNSYKGGTSGLTDLYSNIWNADLTQRTFATTFTKNYLLKFNFIQFMIYNKEDNDCIFNNLLIVFTSGFKNIGTR